MTEFTLNSHNYNGRYMYLTCTQEAVPEKNKSIIHWVLTVTGGTSDYYTTGPTTVTIDGQTVYYSPLAYWNAYKFPAAKGSVSGILDVYHDAEGQKTVECSIETSIYTGVLITRKGSYALEDLQRTSTVEVTGNCFIGSTCTVLADRKNSAYTHTIAFCAPDMEGFLCADGSLSKEPVQLEVTSIPFQIPTYLYDRIPNALEIECALVCTTYLGDLQIGEDQRYTFFASCSKEDCTPLVYGEVVDCNEITLALTGDENLLVQHFSCARCQIDAVAQNGANIKEKQIGNTLMTEDTLIIPNVETNTFLFRATDTRGFNAEYTAEKTLIPYQKLTTFATAKRKEPTSDQVQVTVSGKAFMGSFGLQENAVRVYCYLGTTLLAELDVIPTEGGYTAQGTVDGLSYKASCLMQVIAKDALMETVFSVQVTAGIPIFDVGKNDVSFHVPVHLSDGSEAASKLGIYPVGSLYLSWSHSSPAELFGGTWERIINPETGEGVFLYSAAHDETVGTFGGEATHTLTVKEMPGHYHDTYVQSIPGGSGGGYIALTYPAYGAKATVATMSEVGGNLAHNNIPPFVKVSIWRRVE